MKLKQWVILLGVFFGLLTLTSLFRKVHPIGPKNVGRYVNQTKPIIFEVGDTFKANNGDVFIYPVESLDFSVLIPNNKTSIFAKHSELYFLDKKLKVTGEIKQVDTKYQIIVTRRDQVKELK